MDAAKHRNATAPQSKLSPIAGQIAASMGLIDPEVFTKGSSARDFYLSENLGGVTHDWFASTSGYNDKLRDSIEGFEFVPFIPPASVSGVRMEEHRRIPVKPDGWAIGHTNEHPVETIKYFDFWFSEEGRRLANFGIEGVHYTGSGRKRS